MPPDDDANIRLDIARLEGKVDVAITNHGAQIHELQKDVADHELRIRAEEQRPRVTPKHLYMGLSAAVLVLGGLVSLVNLIS